MKRIYLVLAVAAVMAMMFVVTASPAFAAERTKAKVLKFDESPRLVVGVFTPIEEAPRLVAI